MSHVPTSQVSFEGVVDFMSKPVNSAVAVRFERKRKTAGDRFIPQRSSDSDKIAKEADARVLSFCEKAPTPAAEHVNTLKVLYSQANKPTKPVRATRQISSRPAKVLDAPDLVDNYYFNLLDWSCSNVLAIALGQTIYLWEASTGSINELLTLPEDDIITSLSWIKEGGSYLAVGTSNADVQLWDIDRQKMLRSMKGHASRVSALDWNSHVLSSGSMDSTIFNHDVRVAEHHVGTFKGHEQEICQLKWSPDGSTLASGGNDNMLCLWDKNDSTKHDGMPRHVLRDHTAAVKALAWSPHQQHLLASGAGSSDRTIKFWNTITGSCVNSVDTGSQVCSLLWNPYENEILSSHGYSKNEISLWSYPSMIKVKEICEHTDRVLHMALGAQGKTVCSASADQTLKFWNMFEPVAKKTQKMSTQNVLSQLRIR
eukprot:TRINITY_DN301247_c0_g1_i1.p1 TRINITY_DN301247_c0_g1~~TRINITY_DN301247_c0_g1_i1.p1  ORF type:complete len:427 (-),score=106.50 TRINITY_DN301247_c0_g1_i1:657-1937(-)